ncbi:NB-ARC domain-containing protein [Streptomyces sp. NPDC058812]|uniref:NB-ARC domain-containing protein n=1 Tax=unclassified Streptomyces TaxID=2593676 RepID=UPI0036B2BB81
MTSVGEILDGITAPRNPSGHDRTIGDGRCLSSRRPCREEADAVIKAVRRTWRWRGSATVAITIGLHGAGGFGRTSLARYVAAQQSVQRRFPGAVHLITIGREVRGRAAIAAKVAEGNCLITGDTSETGPDPELAGNHSGALLAKRPRTLLVIDDVWERDQLDFFMHGAERACVPLSTTSRPDVLPSSATRIEVDGMTVDQARQMLTHQPRDLPHEQVRAGGPAAQDTDPLTIRGPISPNPPRRLRNICRSAPARSSTAGHVSQEA